MNIAIIGCGYIGSAAASLWHRKGHHITATTRKLENLKKLNKIAQKSQILKGTDEREFIPLILNNETILVTTAADSPDSYKDTYLGIAEIFRHLALEMDLPRHLIYTSSSSVYGDHNGLWVDETTPLLGHDELAKILIKAEETYLSLQELGWQVSILRLAQIYGPGRELSKKVKELEGHTLPGIGDHYTNMIHQTDCASAIDYALRHHLEGVFNLVDDEHPTRKELYDTISHKFHLPKVIWAPTQAGFPTGNKRVSNHKIKAEGFTFHYPHRVLD
jgi:nucleoside-diphosphate-sugar epimerase